MMRDISPDELRRLDSSEGLVLQGCGGDPQEWIDGVNELLTEAGILKNSDKFHEVSRFEHGGLTNLLFHMDNVDLDAGKLAIWRLQTHDQFGGTWLSDYVPNRLNGFVHSENERQGPGTGMCMGGME